MEVYILKEGHSYEGSEPIGCYSTKEKAVESFVRYARRGYRSDPELHEARIQKVLEEFKTKDSVRVPGGWYEIQKVIIDVDQWSQDER